MERGDRWTVVEFAFYWAVVVSVIIGPFIRHESLARSRTGLDMASDRRQVEFSLHCC